MPVEARERRWRMDAESQDYLVIQVTVSAFDLQRQRFNGSTREERDTALKDYLETLGLRPRHGCGTLEWWDDPVCYQRHYRQRIPREE
jgi:hypothetical protein